MVYADMCLLNSLWFCVKIALLFLRIGFLKFGPIVAQCYLKALALTGGFLRKFRKFYE